MIQQTGKLEESQFLKVTGLSFNEMETRLARYVRQRVFRRVSLGDISLPEEGHLQLRQGYEGEESLILGRVRLATRGPSEAAGYILHANRQLQSSAESAASVGFLDYRNENFKEADRFFTEALVRGTESPSHYLYAALSKMRIRNPHGILSYRNLGKVETEVLMDLLIRARELGESRPLLYQTVARVGLNSILRPSDNQLSLLEEGVSRFQNDPTLGYYLALLLDRRGHSEEAKRLFDHYASFELDYETRLIFEPVLLGADNS